jgi:hypothetical protein
MTALPRGAYHRAHQWAFAARIVVKIRCFVTPPRGIKVGALKPILGRPDVSRKEVFSTG